MDIPWLGQSPGGRSTHSQAIQAAWYHRSLSLSLYLSKCFLYKRQHIVFYWREARKPSHIPKSTNHKSHVKNSSSFSKTTLSHSHEIYHWYKLHHEIDHEMISSPPFSFSPKTGDRFESTSLPFASAPTWRPFR